VSFLLSSFTHSDPNNQYPSQIYDIRRVFDGSIIKKGWNGYPTQIYTSVFPTSVFPEPLGATSDPPKKPRAEIQTIYNHRHRLTSLKSKN
jgi:beta-fructofuranosidase